MNMNFIQKLFIPVDVAPAWQLYIFGAEFSRSWQQMWQAFF